MKQLLFTILFFVCVSQVAHAEKLVIDGKYVFHGVVPVEIQKDPNILIDFLTELSKVVRIDVPEGTKIEIVFAAPGKEEMVPGFSLKQKAWVEVSGRQSFFDDVDGCLGFYYDGLNALQVNPELFQTLDVYEANGILHDSPLPLYAYDYYPPPGYSRIKGYGYYVIGHEWAHHLLHLANIPAAYHHYRMSYWGINRVILEYVLKHNLANEAFHMYWQNVLLKVETQIAIDQARRLATAQ